MTRVASFIASVALVVMAGGSTAVASPGTISPNKRVSPHSAVLPLGPMTSEAAEPFAKIIWLNRCPTGCTFTKSNTSDALSNRTIIGGSNEEPYAQGTVMTISPFAQSETMWQSYLTCMREVYGPYDVQIVTEDPGNVPHHEAVVAGRAAEMGKEGALGVAPLDGTTCVPKNNVISFTYANDERAGNWEGLCWTTAQESAHSFGLDHAFDCSDPLTYIDGCGQKFFRNKDIKCGEYAVRPCTCGAPTQNSHQKLLSVFGPGTDPAPPVVTLNSPQAGPVNANFSVFATASDHRGVAYAELYINGWKWYRQPATESATFVLNIPPTVPDGVMDLQVRACNDLDICAETAPVTVTRGQACGDATACLTGQKCEAGKCFWDAPVAEFGSACAFNEECLSGLCNDTGAGLTCTESCFGPPNDLCPAGFECNAGAGAAGVCRVASSDDGGCCSTGNASGTGVVLVNLGLGSMIGLLVMRRRRRKA